MTEQYFLIEYSDAEYNAHICELYEQQVLLVECHSMLFVHMVSDYLCANPIWVYVCNIVDNIAKFTLTDIKEAIVSYKKLNKDKYQEDDTLVHILSPDDITYGYVKSIHYDDTIVYYTYDTEYFNICAVVRDDTCWEFPDFIARIPVDEKYTFITKKALTEAVSQFCQKVDSLLEDKFYDVQNWGLFLK